MHMDACKFLTLLTLLVISTSSGSEIFKWVDNNGKTHFTDTPPPGEQAEELQLKINTYTAAEVTPLIQRLGRKNKVVMYDAAWCGVCKQAKQYFREKRIAYVSYDVENNQIGKRDFKRLKGRSVPIIILGNKRMNGFTIQKFENLYRDFTANRATTPD